MHRTTTIGLFTLTLLAACGGSGPADQEPTGPAVGGPTAGAEAGETGGGPAEGAGAGGQGGQGPAEPQAMPIEATDAEAVKVALLGATGSGEAFVRIIDPDRGVGAWDRSQNQQGHFCDSSRFSQEPSLGYEIRDTDEWTCDEEITRCTSVDPDDRTGTVFHFHQGGGNGRWLSSVIRYDRRVPRYDTDDVTAWVRSGEGVCDLWRTLTGSAEQISPARITIYVSRYTEGADASKTDFHCGEEAVAPSRERLSPMMQLGAPTICRREPLSCSWVEADEIRVYGNRDDGSPYAIAVLGTGLREGPTRMQEREVAAAAQRAKNRRCQ